MFIDKVNLQLSAGKGGNGVISWRREKFVPKGGPAGGNGGNGGSIVLQATAQHYSLEDFRHRPIIKAKNGENGRGSNQHGKTGEDLVLLVPIGTIVKDQKTGQILHDFTKDKETYKVCQGGMGGKGNTFFKSSTQRAPVVCTEGTIGEYKEVELELKLLADIGLVGFPNAGKSTLISSLTNIKVKIAPYPFTTLTPNLGLIEFEDYTRLLMADIPGIIENAHQNKGLGFAFLKHIERTSILIFVIDIAGIDGRDPWEDFVTLQNELKAYNPHLLEKPFLVVLNKIDEENTVKNIKKFEKKYPHDPKSLYKISALNKTGIIELKKGLHQLAKQIKNLVFH
jgi:GTP-binding protein